MSWEIKCGDALERLREMPDESVQCCVTSPPYWGQRSYGSDEEIGQEPQLSDYIANLVATFDGVRRVLASDGTLWLNVGDTFSGGRNGKPGPQADGKHRARTRGWVPPQAAGGSGLANKQLCGVPWRLALALQEAGWFLRCDVIWEKPNTLPDGSARDRPSRNHEYIFLLTKQPRYFFDLDAIREESDPNQQAHNERYAKVYDAHTERSVPNGQPGNANNEGIHSRPGKGGRPKRSVWRVSTVPFADGHTATFPPKLIEPCVLAGSKPGDIVLDPFAGAATTGLVSTQLGRDFIGIELNPDYVTLGEDRIRRWEANPAGHLKNTPPLEGQLALATSTESEGAG
jgi:DNA modification methylase